MTTTAKTSARTISMLEIEKTPRFFSIRSGGLSGWPRHSRPTFWRMNDMPMAVMSGASFGALRSGL